MLATIGACAQEKKSMSPLWDRTLHFNMLVHKVKRGLASLDELCPHVCEDTDRALHDELVVRERVIDSAEFWTKRPAVRARAQQVVINVDGRPAQTRVLDMITARKQPSSPVHVSADWMAAILVDDASLERRWRETAASSATDGKVVRSFWRSAVHEYARRAWDMEVVVQRNLTQVDSLSLSAVVHARYSDLHIVGLSDANAGFISNTFSTELKNTLASSTS